MGETISGVVSFIFAMTVMLTVMTIFWVIRTLIAHWFNEIYHTDGGLSPSTTFVEKVLGWIRFF